MTFISLFYLVWAIIHSYSCHSLIFTFHYTIFSLDPLCFIQFYLNVFLSILHFVLWYSSTIFFLNRFYFILIHSKLFDSNLFCFITSIFLLYFCSLFILCCSLLILLRYPVFYPAYSALLCLSTSFHPNIFLFHFPLFYSDLLYHIIFTLFCILQSHIIYNYFYYIL